MPLSFAPINPSIKQYPNTFNLNPSQNLAKWRLALAKVRDNSAGAKILCCGDSTTMGIGSTLGTTYPSVGSFPSLLAKIFNQSTLTPAILSLAVPPSNTDDRWNITVTGWSLASGFGFGNQCYNSNTAGATIIYTPNPQVNCDGFYIYTLQATGLGTLTCTASGGTPVAIAEAGSQTIVKTLVSAASASTSNTLTMVSTGTTYFSAIEPVLSTKNQILIDNAGVGGTTSTSWNSGTAAFTSAKHIQAVAPDLTIISLGINDATSSVAPTTVQTNLQALITAAIVSGDVLLCDMPPSNGAPYTTYEPLYAGVYSSLAASNNCAYLSEFGRLNKVYQSNYMWDNLHPTEAGYFDWAQFIANIIAAP